MPTMRTLCLLCLFCLVGCTGAELAIVGAASSGLQTGNEITRTGRLKIAVMEEGPTAVAAAERVCTELGLKVYDRRGPDDYKWVLSIADRRRTMRVVILERTPKLTQVEVNVGIFGSTSVAELILKRVVAELERDDEPAL